MSRLTRRLVAVPLTLSMILSCVPISAFAKTADGSVSPSVKQPANPTESIELEEKRDTFSKHFRMSDGSMQAVSYEMPIHFQDENGAWQEYDNTLTETDALPDDGESKNEKDYVNTKSDFSVRLSKKTNGKKFVRLEIDGYKISWYYKNAKKQTGVVTEKQADNDPTTLENINTEVLYRNIYSGVDLQYIVSSNHLKENLILANKNTVKTFTAEYKIGELTAVSVDDKTIEFRKENGEALYTLNAPYMSDAAGVTCGDIALQITSRKNGKVTVQTILNEEWLAAEERQFPVVVDPVITADRKWGDATNCQDAYIASDMPNACFGRGGNYYEGSLYVGQTYGRSRTRALLQVPNLPDIGVGSKVIDARVSFLVRECYPEIRMDLYRVTSPWQSNTVCWNSDVTTDWQILDYQVVPITYRTDTNVEGWQTFEITDLVRGWYSGEYPNYGICLMSESEWSSSQARAWMYSNNFPGNQVVRPLIQISYRNMSGYEDYWTYTSLPAGKDGMASVNNFNGNLVYSQPLFSDDNTLIMPVNLSLIYNQNKTGADHGCIGNHFQTNYHVFVAYDAATAELGYKYCLNDADGTKHWFYFENGSNEGKDEDGLGYQMTVNEGIFSDDRDSYKFTITDKAKNKMHLNGLGLLKCIEDANGNKALVSYNAQNCIQTVTNGSGQVYTFSYNHEWDSSKVTSLTNPAGTTLTLEYDGSNNLTAVHFPDGTLHLWHDGSNRLCKIYFGYENVVNIQYDASQQQRVSYMDLQSSDGEITSDRYWFDYRQNATNVTDKLDRLFTYQFNDYGQTTGIVSGESGEVQTWQYEPGNTTSAKANKIISQSRVFSGTENLIVNPMIERELSQSYDVYYTEDVIGGRYAVRNASMGHYNNGCIEIHKEQMPGVIFAYQECTVTPGTYTLSCYVNTNGIEISGLGATLELDAWNNGQFERCVISERIKSTNGWERISTTIEIDQTRTLRSMFALDSYTAGTVYFDDIQLEKSAGETSFNLVENSAFANGLFGWKTGGDWPTLGFNPNPSTLDCTDCARFAGNIGSNRRNLYQTIDISGKANDTFSFGAWVYAQSVPIENGTKENDPYQPMFEVLIEYYDMDGNFGGAIRQTANADFCHGWQFVSGKAVIPAEYSCLQIVCWYSHNANDCFFTDAFCYKEPYDSTLSYDNNGNVVFNTDIQSATCKYAYEDNNIAKITSPTGSRMFYTYDDNNQANITDSLSSDGLHNHYNYNDRGNLLQSTLKSRKPVTVLEDGKTYFIVNAYSGQLIDSGNDPANIPVTMFRFDEAALSQQWKLEAVPNEKNQYRLENMAYLQHYFRVEDNSPAQGQGFYINGKREQTFKILLNADNTFSIFTSASDFEKCLDAQYDVGEKVVRSICLRQAVYYPEAENMRWCFYPVECDDVNTITSTSTYTENGAYLSASTDSLGNTTSYSYDQTKHVLNSATNAKGVETSYTYEENTNRLKTVSVGGVSVHYAYNDKRLLSEIDTNSVNGGTKYQLSYDSTGRLSQTKVGNGTDFITLSTNEYGENNLLKKQTYGNGAYFENSYDRLDRLAGITYNGSTTGVRYQYNSAGLLSSVKDYTVNRYVKNSYDTLGRIERTATFAVPDMNKSMLSSASFRYEDRTGRLTGYTYKTLKTASDYQSLDFGIVYGNNTDNERIKKLTLNGQDSLGYTYDAFGRLAKLNYLGVSSSPSSIYTYVTDTENHKTSLLVQSVTNPVIGELSYSYDALGNITEIRKNGQLFASYTYDDLNQLSSVTVDGVTTSYTYLNGNIVSQTVNGEITKSYGYTNPAWADLLTEYNGQTITYDAIGNPLQYRDGLIMTWQNGRQLASITKTDLSASYSYGLDGIRTAKTVNGITTEYYWQNGILQGQRTGNDSILFLYNASGAPYGMICKTGETESAYYYLFNAQGDVIALLDSAGNCVAEYTYDEWGKLLTVTGSQADTTGLLNPIRYRGYYYDSETGFYYLQSRYYDPETGRFINADSQLNTSLGVLGCNMFAYCLNNPVNKVDYSGNKPGDLFDTMDEAARDFAEYINAKSIEDNREYASYIYTKTVTETKTMTYINPNIFVNNPLSWLWNAIFGGGFTKTVTTKVKVTKYTYREPSRGTTASSAIPINWFGIHNQVALLHTHAAYDPNYLSDIFSQTDKNLAKQRSMPIYVATPIGTLRKYNPSNGKDIVIYNDIPFDPNHPGRK